MNDFKFILQWKIGSKPQAKSPRLEKVFLLKEFSEGRKNQEAYTAFFDHFVPCATKKTTWDRRLAKTKTDLTSSSPERLCSVSDEAFALLLLENSFERWLDIFSNHKNPVMQQRGVRQREFQSDVPTVYTRGGSSTIRPV